MNSSEWSDAVFDYPPEELKFWKIQARDVKGPITVIPCGTGDLLIAFAHQFGQLTGVDADPAMVATTMVKLMRKVPSLRDRVRLAVGRLEEAPKDVCGSQMAIFVPRNGWWCLRDVTAMQAALHALYQRLVLHGRLVIDAFHVTDTERIRKSDLVPKMPRRDKVNLLAPVGACRITSTVTYRGNKRTERYVYHRPEGPSVAFGKITLTCLPSSVMANLIIRSGCFEVEALWGGWDYREFYSSDPTARQIWVLRKK